MCIDFRLKGISELTEVLVTGGRMDGLMMMPVRITWNHW